MRHLVIPDIQAKPGVKLDHCKWLGEYINDVRPERIICLGDLWDYPSLSSYEDPKKSASEGANTKKDFLAGCRALEYIEAPWKNAKGYKPEKDFTYGNHEVRVDKHISKHPHLAGSIDRPMDYLAARGWRVHAYQAVAKIDGIAYSHLFPRNAAGRVTPHAVKYGAPSALAMVRNNMSSCTAGHRQGRLCSEPIKIGNKIYRGLIVGSFYMHDEKYMGPQGNGYWRGVILKTRVRNGNYELNEISIDKLREMYG